MSTSPRTASASREGRYLLRTNLTETDSVKLWNYYLQPGHVEEAFRTLKSDLAIRPIFHQEQERIEAHVFIAFLAPRAARWRSSPLCRWSTCTLTAAI
jgi:transposase